MENLVILEILYSFPLNTVVCIWLAGHFEAGLPCISFQVKFFSFLKKKKSLCSNLQHKNDFQALFIKGERKKSNWTL